MKINTSTTASVPHHQSHHQHHYHHHHHHHQTNYHHHCHHRHCHHHHHHHHHQQQQKPTSCLYEPNQQNLRTCLSQQQQTQVSCLPEQQQTQVSCLPEQQQTRVCCLPKQQQTQVSCLPEQQQRRVSCLPKQQQTQVSCLPEQQQTQVSCLPEQQQRRVCCLPKQQQTQVSCLPKQQQTQVSCLPEQQEQRPQNSTCCQSQQKHPFQLQTEPYEQQQWRKPSWHHHHHKEQPQYHHHYHLQQHHQHYHHHQLQQQQQQCALGNNLRPLRVLVVVVVVALLQTTALGCRISEFTCGSSECVPADAYCDGEPDCSDRTDEPRDCSPCNRTFYGDVGRSYEVTVERPKNMLTTFTCHLTFVAEGDEYGDIVQLTIQDFRLGDFFSYNSGCPQGWMQISERERPYTDGYWCGDGRGFNVYFSETSTTTLTLKKFIPMDYIHFEGLLQSPFNFRLTYKTLRRSDAILRYGNATSPKNRGDLVDGSLCDRIFLNCDEYTCSVQSPNFPGLYPRHVTCHFLIKQTRYVPYAKPLITIHQDNPLRFNVKANSALPSQGLNSPGLQIWGSCDLVHDHLLVYDGNSTESPLFLKVCGSGPLPPITSTGPEMLVVFSTSRFDEPTQETLMPRTFGFELDVKVTYLNMDSRQFARNRQCVFHIFGANNASGEVVSVVNTQPQNSSCVYLFHGEPHEVVWVHFRKYEIAPKMGHYTYNMTECINPLRIYDGNFFDTNTPYGSPRRARLIQEHCTARPPPMCAREYLPPRRGLSAPVKACTRNESYVADGPKLTVVQHYNESTAALAMDFILRYEFVNTRPGYRPTNGSECDFEAISDGYSLRTGRVFSPRTSVLYGRWGRRKLSCQYRLTAHSDEVVRVTVTKFHSVSRSCLTTTNNFTGSYDCDSRAGQTASLVISEYPWQEIEVPRLCTCDYSAIPIEYESKSQELRLKFEVNNMDETHDYLDFMFEAQYEFVKKTSCRKEQRLQGTNGEIVFRKANLTEHKPCDNYPWLLQTSDADKSIYFRIRGYDHIDKNCTTTTRLLVFKVGRLRPVAVLCPDSSTKNVVELYSFAWQGSSSLVEQSTDKLVLEVSGRDSVRDPGPHKLSWLQVSPVRQYDWSSEGIVRGCQEECPELRVCISEILWCDGVHHCPSGYDELIAHCFFLSVPWAYIGVGSALSVILLVGVTVYGAARLRAADKKTHQHPPIPTLPTASESLFSSDKDAAERDGGVTSAYSLDYSEVDYVTTL